MHVALTLQAQLRNVTSPVRCRCQGDGLRDRQTAQHGEHSLRLGKRERKRAGRRRDAEKGSETMLCHVMEKLKRMGSKCSGVKKTPMVTSFGVKKKGANSKRALVELNNTLGLAQSY